jgi:type II secretory pathway pseudopilin PulG
MKSGYKLQSRTAYSLIELLVVVAILVIVFGLILSGIQATRQRADKASVQNVFRQVQLALNQYSDANSGAIPDVTGEHPPSLGRTPLEAIAPYLEISKTQDGSTPTFLRLKSDPSSDTAAAAVVIPGPPGNVNQRSSVTDGTRMGATSIAVNAHVFRHTTRLPTSVTDGLSSTISFAQHYSVCGSAPTGPSTFVWTFTQSQCFGQFGPVPCTNPTLRRATFADDGYDDVRPTIEITNGATQVIAFQMRPQVGDCNYRVLQAHQPGGLIVACFDGSVRTIRESISPRIFWSLVTHNSGELANIE